MEVNIKLKDGWEGKSKTLPGGRMSFSITGPDTPLNRVFVLECLFSLQLSRPAYMFERRTGHDFPALAVESPTISHNVMYPDRSRTHGIFREFTIKEDRWEGRPFFYTFGQSREDLEAAVRCEMCMNRHTGLSNAEIERLPHFTDMQQAYQLLIDGIRRAIDGPLLPDEHPLASLRCSLEEALTYYDPDKLKEPTISFEDR